MQNEIVLIISEDGDEITSIYDETGIADQFGITKTCFRASFVEPKNNKWLADLSPVNGPVIGVFELRSEALEAERRWLLTNNFGNYGGNV